MGLCRNLSRIYFSRKVCFLLLIRMQSTSYAFQSRPPPPPPETTPTTWREGGRDSWYSCFRIFPNNHTLHDSHKNTVDPAYRGELDICCWTYLQSDRIQSEIPRVPDWIVQGIFDSFQLRRIFLQKLTILSQLCLSDDFYIQLRFD